MMLVTGILVYSSQPLKGNMKSIKYLLLCFQIDFMTHYVFLRLKISSYA